NLQSRILKGDARRALEEASTRVRAVATVHDQLWRQADVREIDLAPFLSTLVATIALTAPQHSTTLEVEPVVLSADMAVLDRLARQRTRHQRVQARLPRRPWGRSADYWVAPGWRILSARGLGLRAGP